MSFKSEVFNNSVREKSEQIALYEGEIVYMLIKGNILFVSLFVIKENKSFFSQIFSLRK